MPLIYFHKKIFRHSITAFDEAICSDFQRCFPTDGLDKIPDEAIDQVLLENPQISAATCGTTAILSLSDPSQRDVWVACLGDSYAGKCLALNPQSILFSLTFCSPWSADNK